MNVGVRLVTVGKKGNLYFKRRADKYNLAGGRADSYSKNRHHGNI